MQPQFNRNQRERPLQKSMFLQSQQYGNRNSNDYQYQQLNTMKRSAIGVQNNQSANFMHNISQPTINNNPNFPPNHQVLNFSTTPRHRDVPQKMSLTNIPSFHNQNQSNSSDLAQRIQRLTKIVERHELILSKQKRSDSPLKLKILNQDQMQELQTNIKDKILPSLLNKQIYQNMFHFKMDIQGLKDEVAKISKITDKNKIDMQNKFKQITIGAKNTNSLSPDKNISAKIQQIDINSRLLILESNFNQKDDSLKKIIAQQIQKSKKLKFSPQKTLKISAIKSSLSPIMLEYQQLFYVKYTNNTGKLSLKKQQEILINSCVYYIDKQGYLLDNINRYIVDAKGMQVKLEEKHLTALKNHHILN